MKNTDYNHRDLRASDLRLQVVELTAERDAFRAQLAGELPQATRWLQRKVWRQAAALDALNRRVVTQRFVLRTLDGLGRSLSAEEYRAARARRPTPSSRPASTRPQRTMGDRSAVHIRGSPQPQKLSG